MADEVSFLCHLGKRYHLQSADFHFSSDVASLAIAIVVFREENTLDKGGIVVGASYLFWRTLSYQTRLPCCSSVLKRPARYFRIQCTLAS